MPCTWAAGWLSVNSWIRTTGGVSAGEVTVTLNGERVFEVRQDPLDPVFALRGLRDVTGNGHADLAVISRSGRSTARFVLLELQPGGVAVLHEETGMTEAILGAYGALTNDQLGALAGLAPHREGFSRDALGAAREMPVAAAPGRWVFRPGNWNEGSAAELAWARRDARDDSLSEIRFCCPDNSDDIWVLINRRHGTVDEVSEDAAIIADGRTIPLRLAPQLDDETGVWYPIGMLARRSDLLHASRIPLRRCACGAIRSGGSGREVLNHPGHKRADSSGGGDDERTDRG